MSSRVDRVNQLIKKELSQIILREVEFPPDVLVTLTRVETSTNIIESKVYVSCLPDSQRARALGILKSAVWQLQQILNKRLRMRPIPKIIFMEEKETFVAGGIEEVLESLKKKIGD
jgi:ribosome-binding factor A